jgi:hypothetical protein
VYNPRGEVLARCYIEAVRLLTPVCKPSTALSPSFSTHDLHHDFVRDGIVLFAQAQ